MPASKKFSASRKSAKALSPAYKFILGIIVFVFSFFGTLAFLTYFNVLDIDGIKNTSNTSQQVGTLVGTYTGTTPCADCPGIDTTLTLVSSPDVYTLRLEYQEKDTTYTETGTWKIEPMKNGEGEMYVLTPSSANSQPGMYQILNDNEIRQLDGDGNPIPDNMPFTLTKE